MVSGESMKKETSKTIIHIMHRKIMPPIMMPIHAIGRPDSFCLRMRLSEITPYTSASIPNKKLTGRHNSPVNGSGSIAVQNDMVAMTPKIRLRMD